MLGELVVLVASHDINNHNGRQQLVEDYEMAVTEKMNRGEITPSWPFPSNLIEVPAQSLTTLADAGRMLDVVFGNVKIDQIIVVAVQALLHKVQDASFIFGEVLPPARVVWILMHRVSLIF
jgi:hypothetical protein